jgi:hypothetical protein
MMIVDPKYPHVINGIDRVAHEMSTRITMPYVGTAFRAPALVQRWKSTRFEIAPAAAFAKGIEIIASSYWTNS